MILLFAETLLKRTKSRCPVCRVECPGEVWKIGDAKQQRVVMRRRCAEHGEVEVCIASDARFYWLAQGDPQNACCGGNACSASDGAVRGTLGRNAAVPAIENQKSRIENLSTCLALIEIVNSCNLACPTCFADSPRSTQVDAVPLAELQARIQGVIDRKGGIEILQLSGGEPTLHPQFFELLEWARDHEKIDYLLLNTNGVRIANEPEFAAKLGQLFARGGLQLYLQFDGVQAAGLLNIPLCELGADAVAIGGHKNLFGLNGSGVLYLRPDLIEKSKTGLAKPMHYVKSTATEGFEDQHELHRFEGGNPNYLGLFAFRRSAAMIKAIGTAARVHARHRLNERQGQQQREVGRQSAGGERIHVDLAAI